MNIFKEILKKYWGYNSFKPLQEEIIKSVYEGNDTLGLMPTGGGKSITFQVPALAKPGICIVVTPLIALMKDQVEKLTERGIKSAYLFSGMTYDEIITTLNNCLYGDYKFLYISPERIETEIFRIRFQSANVNLITVDEAHCISQWGYDFRPSYLKIVQLREMFPEAPILALTATATPVVIDDIQEKLKFKKKNVLKTSFERKNLIYIVKKTDNKVNELLSIINKFKGSGIVYVRSRQRAQDLTYFLKKYKISVDYYHAGLKTEVRSERQDAWTKGAIRIMVATNAFGMGIDKPDVRFVVHFDLPDSIEAYFQEAGRAGRDGKKAYAIMLVNEDDKKSLETRLKQNFPPLETVKNIYQAACNYCKVPLGGGKGMAFDFDITDFAYQYKFNIYTAYSSLKLLQLEGYIELTDELHNPSRIKFIITRDELYKFQVKNAQFDNFIKLLLRSYTGLFTEYTAIDEFLLARRAGVPVDIIFQYLNKLSSLKIINYIPQKNSPLLIFHEERLDNKSIYISPENYLKRKQRYKDRLTSIINYAFSENKCRQVMLLHYFGETKVNDCQNCDVCQKNKQQYIDKNEFLMLIEEIKSTLKLQPQTIKDLIEKIPFEKEKIIRVIRWMLDNSQIYYDKEQKLNLKNNDN